MKNTCRIIGMMSIVFLVTVSIPTFLMAQPISVRIPNHAMEDGSTFWTPMGSKGEGNEVALFSKSDKTHTIKNTSDAPVTINNIQMESAEGVQAEEFQLRSEELKTSPLEFEETTLQPGDEYEFMLRFYPVHSHERKATVKITYNGDQTYQWTVVGQGRNDAQFFSHGNVAFSKLLGAPAADEFPAGMVADNQGNMYVSGRGTMVVDSFNNDIYFARVNNDGSLGWSWIWNSEEDDKSIATGQNGESGGSSDAMSMGPDGDIYFAGTRDNAAIVLKLNSNNGKPVWEKYWMAGWPSYSGGRHTSSDHADAYSVDVQGSNVYVTGTTQNSVLLLSLNRADGTINWQKKLDLYDGYKDRGYTVRADGNGHLYVAGSGNNDGFIAKLNTGGETPRLAWSKQVQLSTGGNVNSIDLDSSGNIYLSCDRRGAQTFFSIIKMSPKGKHVWGKTWEASNTDSNNSHVVRVIGNHVYWGGRVGIPTFDTQFGDGALVKFKLDGTPVWKSFYYSGKGPGEMTEHRIKGIAESGDDLLVYSQAYTSSYNKTRFWGYWYDGVGSLKDFSPTIKSINVNTEKFFVNLEDGKAKDVSGMRNYVDGTKHFNYQDARIKYDGEANNADLMFWKLNMEE